MDELEHAKFIYVIINVNANDEVKRGVPPVDNFVLSMIEEGTLVLRSRQTLANELTFQSDTLLHGEAIIVL
jgi:hypothetical protein